MTASHPLRPRIVVRGRLCASRPASSPPSSSSSPASPTQATRPASRAPATKAVRLGLAMGPTWIRTTPRVTARRISVAKGLRADSRVPHNQNGSQAFVSQNARRVLRAKQIFPAKTQIAQHWRASLPHVTVGYASFTVMVVNALLATCAVRTVTAKSSFEVGGSW